MLRHTHPSYDDIQDEWQEINDVLAGSRVVKSKTITYLPATEGHYADGFGTPGSVGQRAYDAYLHRANFPSLFEDANRRILGLLHRNNPNIKLPESMQSLIEDATGDGTNLSEFLRDINSFQLGIGRCGILADLKVLPNGSIRPVVKLYSGTTIPNWSTNKCSEVEFVLLNETSQQLNKANFKYEQVKRFRILRLTQNEEGETQYVTATTDDEGASIPDLTYITPNAQGQTISQIPFCFVNAGDTKAAVSMPPLTGLKNMVLSIYLNSSNYEQALFNCSSETLVILGRNQLGDDDENVRIGTGAKIELNAAGDAKFIGPNSKSIPEQRTAIDAKFERASQLAGQLAIQSKSDRSTSDSLSVRIESATAAYSALALAGASALEHVLRAIAPLFGVREEDVEKEIVITPNLEFANSVLDSDTFVDLQNAKINGLKISDKSLHEILRKRGATELDYEAEKAQIELETETQSLL